MLICQLFYRIDQSPGIKEIRPIGQSEISHKVYPF